jgi:hypothetical protein
MVNSAWLLGLYFPPLYLFKQQRPEGFYSYTVYLWLPLYSFTPSLTTVPFHFAYQLAGGLIGWKIAGEVGRNDKSEEYKVVENGESKEKEVIKGYT